MSLHYVLTDFTQLQGEVRERNALWRSHQDLYHAALRVALEQAQAVLDAVSH